MIKIYQAISEDGTVIIEGTKEKVYTGIIEALEAAVGYKIDLYDLPLNDPVITDRSFVYPIEVIEAFAEYGVLLTAPPEERIQSVLDFLGAEILTKEVAPNAL